LYQVGAIHKRMDVCTLGQYFVIQFVNSGMYSFEHCLWV